MFASSPSQGKRRGETWRATQLCLADARSGDMRLPTRHRLALAIAGLSTVALAAPAAATANTYRSYSLAPNGARTSPVAGSTLLHGFLSARFLFPTQYRRLASSSGTLRFAAGARSCHYTVTFSLRFRQAADGTAAEHVAADLVPASSPYLLEDGTRRLNAWRVIRLPGDVVAGVTRVRLRAELARRISAPAGTVPAGQAIWVELRASATSTAGSECHSGTWRQVLGPRIGDALATTTVTRAFIPSV
jgi:hypothetical protein